MDKNKRVAAALGLRECAAKPGNLCGDYGCTFWYGPDDEEYDELPDYVDDIKEAMPLVPKIGQLVTMQYDEAGEDSWSVECISNQILECAPSLSVAIVDAFLAAEGCE